MSHTTTLKSVVVRDTQALRSAVTKLQGQGIRCSLQENVVPRMYYQNQHTACAFVVKLDDCKYDVGFDKQTDGTYAPVFDEWAGHIGKVIGVDTPLGATEETKTEAAIGKLMQAYSEHATINAATAQGYFVESATTDAEGNIHLTLGGY